MVNYRQLEAAIKKEELRSFYIFSGPEDYLKKEMVKKILFYMRKKGKQLYLDNIDGSTVTLDELIQETSQTTVFTQGRLLFVENPPYFFKARSSSREQSLSQQVEKKFKALLEEKASDTIIIFSVPEVDKRKKLVKAVVKAGALVEFPLFKGDSLLKWIKNELEKEDKEVEKEALYELVKRTGEDLRLIKAELDKINTYTIKEKKITADVVKLLVPYGRSGNIFNLVGAVGRKNIKEALFHFHKMREQNQPPLVILSMIARQFRLLFRYRVMLENKKSKAEITSSLKLPNFVVNELYEQLKNYNRSSLAEIFLLLKQTDLAIKTGKRDAEEEIEQLIFKLTAV